MSYNYQDNDEELIDAAGVTIFENVFKQCRHEIKDQIIQFSNFFIKNFFFIIFNTKSFNNHSNKINNIKRCT